MLRAAELRDDREWRRVAQLGAWLLSPWSRKKMTPDKLLKRRPYAPPLIPGDLERRLVDELDTFEETRRAELAAAVEGDDRCP